MKIIGSRLSPFVRYTRAICEELNIDYSFQEVPSMAQATQEELSSIRNYNPAMKVPILQDDDKTILDSRIIVSYLLEKARDSSSIDLNIKMTVEKENHLTLLYAVADSAIMRFLISKNHTNVSMDDGYMKRSLDRIDSCLSHLNQDKEFAKTFGVPELWALYLLQWLSERNMYDWSGHKNLTNFYKENIERLKEF